MAEKNDISLLKTVISNEEAQNIYDNNFNEVIISAEKIDDEKLKKIYEDLFYKISKRGSLSHEKIIIKSDEVIHPETNINYDSQIQQLENNIRDKNEELLNQNIPKNEHPIFSNNTFIQEGDIINNMVIGNQMWFVQEGFKRQINDSQYTNIIRRALGDNLNNTILDSPFYRISTPEEINSILSAQDITNGTDLSTSPLIAKEEQDAVFSQLKVEFECFGVEKWYELSDEEKQEFNTEENGYWYIDPNGYCELQYQTDIDPSESFLPEITTLTFSPIDGRYKQRRISRDQSLYSNENPLSSDFYKTPLNRIDETRNPDSFSTYYPTVASIKEWNIGNKFPAVSYIKPGSRIKIKIMSPTTSDGNPIYQGWMLLHGIDTTAPYQTNILNFFESQYSNYYTKMINNLCYGPVADRCYGKFNQNPNSDEDINKRLIDLFKDPSSRYYKKEREERFGSIKVKGKVYGQPILLVRGKLAVFLGGYRRTTGLTDWNCFYNLEDGGVMRTKNKNLEDDVDGYTRYNEKALFKWLQPKDSDKINNPILYYPGLKGAPINYKHSDLDADPDLGLLMEGIETVMQFIQDFGIEPALNIPGTGGQLTIESITTALNIDLNNQLRDNPFNGQNWGSNFEIINGNFLDIYTPI
jgi:hypothetical protein